MGTPITAQQKHGQFRLMAHILCGMVVRHSQAQTNLWLVEHLAIKLLNQHRQRCHILPAQMKQTKSMHGQKPVQLLPQQTHTKTTA